MEKIRFEFTVEEANAILAALGQQPYLKVVDLIQKMQQQAASQVNGSKPESTPDLEESMSEVPLNN